MSDDAQEWRWVGEDGVEKTVGEQELIAELSSESLPNYTLVWKKGWLEWLPAMQVAELLWALPPGKADTPAKAREKPTANQPPAPPLYRYPVIKRRAATAKADRAAPGAAPRVPPKPIPPLDPPTQVWQPLEAKPVEEVDMDSIESSNPSATGGQIPSAPTRDEDVTVVRDVDYSALPDEPEDDRPSDEPPAPFGPVRTAPAPLAARAYGEEDDAETRLLPSRPPPAGPLYVAPHAPPPTLDHVAFDEADDDMPRIPPPPPPPSDLSAYAGVASGADGTQKRTLGMVGLGAVLTVAAVLGVSSLMRGKHAVDVASPTGSSARAEPVLATELAATAAAAPLAPVLLGKACTITTPATRVADWADPGIVPSFAAVPGSERVVVGFGQSDTYAIGITIDPRTLDRDQVFREFRRQKLVSVVPTSDGGKLHFQVVRDGFPLDDARAIDTSAPLFVGKLSAGIGTVSGKDDPVSVWTLSTDSESTVPRVATVPGVGHAVTFRHGGKSGKVSVGWLTATGAKKTELVDLETHGTLVGTPSIAANDDDILVAFATKNDSGPWGIELAVAKHGELPSKTAGHSLPPGGPGGDEMSPSLGTLSGGRWLLQWTEGSSGNRVARAQILGKDLKPVSPPVNLSPEGVNAGQGAVWATGDVGAVLFYVQNDKKSHGLWGASIECPR